MQEFCVKKKDRVEVVSMLGAFGTLVTVCEMYPFHWKIRTRTWNSKTSSLMLIE